MGAVLSVLICGAGGAHAAEGLARPAASAAKVEESGDNARLTFEFSAPVEAAAAFVLAGPDRVIIDLPEVDFHLDPQAGKIGGPGPAAGTRRGRAARVKSTGLIASYRFGLFAPGKSRIVIDLGAPVRILRARSESADENGQTRFVIELCRTDRQSFRTAVQVARASLNTKANAQPREEPHSKGQEASPQPVVVIDPGHGGIDSGAMVNGFVEKTLVFDFAKTLASKLAASHHFKIVLTRDEDVFIPLGERVKIAQANNATLFVSVHADTLSDTSDVSGATVYTVSDRASDAEAARIAEKENQADSVAGLDGQEDAGDVSDILFDLTRRETRAYSHVFARTLVNYWKVAGRLNKNPQRSAGFRVLKAPDVPSVLLELGYLSNEKDGLALSSPEWRDKAANRVAEAIEAFFAARGTGQPDSSGMEDEVPAGPQSPPRGSNADVAGVSH
jgi:N-acetylmuramoyl-L-alanine amidase